MKLNKKIAVPFLSTVMGLSLIGGVGGAVAWYQYNSRVTASFIGTSVADSTVLQIGTKASANADITWGRDVVSGTENSNKLAPVTFGAMLNEDHLDLPSQAYAYPEAGDGAYTTGWAKASAGKEYVQFEIYLRALAPNGTESSGYKQAARDVYLSDVVLADATDGKDVSGALRVHLGVEGGKNRLISETKVTGLALSGELDLDGDGALDKPSGYAWEQNPSAANVIYGKAGDTQTTEGIDDIVQQRDTTTGYMPETANSKLICTTPLSGEQKIVITVWLEGWAELGASAPKALWNANKTAAAAVRVGLKFDVGRPRPAN